jgi:hypothetical protein
MNLEIGDLLLKVDWVEVWGRDGKYVEKRRNGRLVTCRMILLDVISVYRDPRIS